MFNNRFVFSKLKVLIGLLKPMCRNLLFIVIALSGLQLFPLAPALAQESCPDLSAYYPSDNVNWPQLRDGLAVLQAQCLESSEFYALYGSAQLNSGELADASESLERALLLDPENGSAQIDYAEALYQQDQLFTALELNERLLAREDLPANLRNSIQDRQQNWQSLTRDRSFHLDVLAGHDNNLNGAPDTDQITLTLAGESLLLELNEEFQANSGPFLNFRLGGRFRQLAPDHQHNWLTEVRGRVSEDSASDLLQLNTRYAYIRPGRQHSWQLNTGISHLLFGGTSLYTATDVNARYQKASTSLCKPYYGLSAQHQLFHNQSHLNAAEGRISAGLNCPLAGGRLIGRQQISVEASLLSNLAVKSGRPGGDRDGWQMSVDWRVELAQGEISSQINHTKLNDHKGYSPLLAGGAERWLSRSYLLVQYRRPIFEKTTLMFNLYHQRQRSNLELFKTLDNTIEIGISLPL